MKLRQFLACGVLSLCSAVVIAKTNDLPKAPIPKAPQQLTALVDIASYAAAYLTIDDRINEIKNLNKDLLLLGYYHGLHNKTSQLKQIDKNAAASYLLGSLLGSKLMENEPTLNKDIALLGLYDAVHRVPAKVRPLVMMAALSQYKNELQKTAFAQWQKELTQNQQQEQQFLQQLAKDSQVKKLPSGVYYRLTQDAQGQSAQQATQVKMRYEGRLIDGTVFDSSIARDETVDVEMQHLIQGLQLGIRQMKVGQKATFYIPSRLAY
ncbi:MAG: FKBP-type peptidyl-prolyl cis-trans isomerase, partial [Acinetobacter sp.]|nr:FKBP-type peptidyl-prolyl cis-trans isomerase [Acinetobacter sp.]